MHLRRPVLAILGVVLALAIALAALWAIRARLAAQFAEYYFRQHGVRAAIDVESFGLWSATARFALGPEGAPDLAADRIQLIFDPVRWTPYLTEVRLIKPLIRAQIGPDGKVTLGSLQAWIESLARQGGQSRFVSDNLAVSLTGLRAILDTQAGRLEVGGDLKLRHNKPVFARLHAQPATISWHGISSALRAAQVTYDGRNLSLTFSGDVTAGAYAVRKLDAEMEVQNLRWSDHGLSGSAAHLAAHAVNVRAGAVFDQVKIDVAAQNPSAAGAQASADVSLTASASPRLDLASIGERRLRSALTQGLAHVRLDGAAHLERNGDAISLRATRPLMVEGMNGITLRVPTFSASRSAQGLEAAFDAKLKGEGVPTVNLGTTDLAWADGRLSGNIVLDTRFDYLMLRDAALSAKGAISWQGGRYAFTPASCMPLSLAAFHPGQTDLARNIRATFCSAGKPLLSGEGRQWQLSGAARNVSAFLPLANAQLDGADARLYFTGNGGAFQGSAAIVTARLSDRARQTRFHPIQGSGAVTVAHGKWRGRLLVAGSAKNALATVTFDHDMASGAGAAHIDAPHLVFAQKDLQPENLSPLLGQFRQADGIANFQGEVGWTRAAMTSHGTLFVGNLDFLSPLGRVRGLKTSLEFASLLPFKTADNQQVTISRIDWTLPFSGVDLRFSSDTQTARIDALSSGWAEGHVALAPFTVNLATPSTISGTAKLSSIALDSLVAASNLGDRVKLSGKISGTIPFAAGPQGIHITNGRIAADGPGRLSVDRSLWVQGEAAPAGNAVQDFAYQAMENLAFDQMTADLNSVANGRLQVVFHIKGRSDPPKPQIAEVAISDILNGTALQKQIPLPSGTPIDLTLDTSLNFDELLKSYAEMWSKSLGSAERADRGPGAKP